MAEQFPYPGTLKPVTSLSLQQQPPPPAVSQGGAGSSYSFLGPGGAQYTQTPNLLPQQHQYDQEDMKLKAQLAAQAEARRLASIQGLMGASGGASAGAAPGGNIAHDEEGARAAAFGRAKEQAGNTANAALKALEGVMSARGLKGSSIEGSATADIIGGGSDDVNDYTREQLMQDLNRAAQIGDRNYAGAITMRGQDLSKMQSLLGLFSGGGAY